MLSQLKKGEGSYVLECVCVCGFFFCVCIIGSGALGSKVIAEIGDIGAAVGSLNQSYTSTGLAVGHPNEPIHPTDVATWAGSGFIDAQDFCDRPTPPGDPFPASRRCGVRHCVVPTPEG